MNFKDKDLLQIYGRMLEARYFEDKLDELFRRGLMHGTTHLAIGQEACGVGAAAALKDGDSVSMTHRCHAQAIGAGMNMNTMMAEMFGRVDGCAGGKGGSMHMVDAAHGNPGATGVVGGGFTLSCGMALSKKKKGEGGAVLCFGGDGSVDEGSFHEAMNLAALWKLPVVFFIENNLYAMSTPLEKHSSALNLSDRASSYGIPAVTIDGNDAIEVFGMTEKAMNYARSGEGPVLIEALTYRICGHSKSDRRQIYRSSEEVQKWCAEDPIPKMADYLINKGIATEETLYDMDLRAERKVSEAVLFAQASPEPAPEAVYEDIYAGE